MEHRLGQIQSQLSRVSGSTARGPHKAGTGALGTIARRWSRREDRGFPGFGRSDVTMRERFVQNNLRQLYQPQGQGFSLSQGHDRGHGRLDVAQSKDVSYSYGLNPGQNHVYSHGYKGEEGQVFGQGLRQDTESGLHGGIPRIVTQ